MFATNINCALEFLTSQVTSFHLQHILQVEEQANLDVYIVVLIEVPLFKRREEEFVIYSLFTDYYSCFYRVKSNLITLT
jgi:hypothetical protein